MTYEKVIDKLIDMRMQEIYPVDGEKILQFAQGCVEKADKYKWHNLKDNPDDLPKGGYVIGIHEDGFPEIFDSFRCGDSYWEENIIAWMYIPPFESEETE